MDVVKDFEVIGNGPMKLRAQDPGRALRFSQAEPPGCNGVVPHASTVPRRKIEVMNVPALLLQQQQRAGHHELDVVGMGTDGESGGGSHREMLNDLSQPRNTKHQTPHIK
jgi:hypothetical protein